MRFPVTDPQTIKLLQILQATELVWIAEEIEESISFGKIVDRRYPSREGSKSLTNEREDRGAEPYADDEQRKILITTLHSYLRQPRAIRKQIDDNLKSVAGEGRAIRLSFTFDERQFVFAPPAFKKVRDRLLSLLERVQVEEGWRSES